MQDNKQIYFFLATNKFKEEGKEVGQLTEEEFSTLKEITRQSTSLTNNAVKLREKSAKALRDSNKFMLQVIKSHGIAYDDKKEAVGISLQDEIYIGPIERVKENPDGEPKEGDKIVGSLTKYERRKYLELVNNFDFIRDQIKDHNERVYNNDYALKTLELKLLAGEEYDLEDHYLAVLPNRLVLLCEKKAGM